LTWSQNQSQDQLQLYHSRRKELVELRKKLQTGHARVDQDGRIVPILNPRAPQAVDLPPPPNRAQLLAAFPLANAAAANNNNNNNNNMDNNFNNNNNNPMNNLDHEDADTQWVAQQERQAAGAIARAVRRYREAGVPDEDLFLARVRGSSPGGVGAFTFCRICIAISGVVMAFLFLMLHTLPIGAQLFYYSQRGGIHNNALSSMKQAGTRLLHELLQVKDFHAHAEKCPNLHRNQTYTWAQRWWYRLLEGKRVEDCSNGVLYIPTLRVIVAPPVTTGPNTNGKSRESASSTHNMGSTRDGAVDAVWFMECHTPRSLPSLDDSSSMHLNYSAEMVQQQQQPQDQSAVLDSSSSPNVCTSESHHTRSCFRGIHDDAIDANEAMRFEKGAYSWWLGSF
jgi:hypothetical protein